MENQRLLGSTCVLEVDLLCCKACPLRVKKKLQKITGVNSIVIDLEKGRVAVSGEVDAFTIIDTISKLGKRSKLSSFQKNPTSTPASNTSNVSKKPQSTSSHGSKKPQRVKKNIQFSKSNTSQKGGIEQDCGCHGDDSDLTSDDDDDDDEGDHRSNVHTQAHHSRKGLHHGHAPRMPKGINAPQTPRYHSHQNSVYGNSYFPPAYQSMTRPYVGYGSGSHHYFRPPMFGGTPPLQPVLPAYGLGHHQLPMVPPPPLRPPPVYGYHNQQQRQLHVGNSVLHLFSDDNTSTESCSIM